MLFSVFAHAGTLYKLGPWPIFIQYVVFDELLNSRSWLM